MAIIYSSPVPAVAASVKLEVGHQRCGNSSPSTSEGSPQDHQCQVLDMKEVRNVMGRFEMDITKQGFLGEGSFSICRKGTNITTGEEVAIKAYKVQVGCNENLNGTTLKKFKQQVALLQELQEDVILPGKLDLGRQGISQKPGKFVVRLLDFSRDMSGNPGYDPCDGALYVITELAEHSLKDYLRAQRAQGQALPRENVRHLARSVVVAVAALHAKGYVHLDLKPENLMFFNGRLKIIDVDGCVRIGSIISLQDSSSSFSPCYCAPEWARFLQSGSQSEIVAHPGLDAWSVGLILCECATLSAVMRPAFIHFLKSVNSQADAHMAFIDFLGRLETSPVPDCVENFDAGLGEILSHGLLACDPDLRWTPAQCLSSHYLSSA